ncbi:MAG TPA: rhodanese-like domain-containing protein [Thiohalobacter sp.]|nr:rhodanese-like domain-containing protein [Thiohalobacter sp.]
MSIQRWILGATVAGFTGMAAITGAVGIATAAESSEDMRVKVTAELGSVTVTHDGKKVVIKRNQDPDNQIAEAYAQTGRDCPPFCVQPMQLLPGIHTIGEVELLQMLQRREAGEDSFLFIDSRTPDWFNRGTIPSAENIPWTNLHDEASTYDPFVVETLLLDRFGVKKKDGIFNFEDARKLVLFCNGPWCGQSPTNIRALVGMGYPADKIYWYRGGMQLWHVLGLTTVKP